MEPQTVERTEAGATRGDRRVRRRVSCCGGWPEPCGFFGPLTGDFMLGCR